VDDLTQLAQAARGGDRPAAELLVAGAYPQVRLFCAAVAGGAHAERLTEEVLVRVVETLPKFWGKAEARTWLLTIARKACLDDLKSRRSRRRDGEAEDDMQSVRQAAPDPTPLLDSLASLGAGPRVAFALTQLLGLSYEEAATVCGCAPDIVRIQVLEAREELLADQGPPVDRRA
jgi:RNA polymerase sigma-70 factor, ECF subfamily